MRGITIAIFILCVSVMGGFMATSGYNAWFGVDQSPGLQDEAQQVNDSVGGEQDLSERGGNSGLLGFAVFATKQVAVLFVLVGSITSTLYGWGFPISLAAGIELLARIIQGFALLWIARGLIGE